MALAGPAAEPFEGSMHHLAGSQSEGVGGQDVCRGASCLGIGGSAVTSAVSRGWGRVPQCFWVTVVHGQNQWIHGMPN